ncbi:hypothetical protein B7990_03400 [Fibrobacter sp. UWB4]|uniref:HD domain-containing protein n=1 Tax=Fibrobacter sp. UWB4 TaxID=1964356 RepID=UPI000B52271C|nr:ATP-binding protein [Fibrobacter sp. UWB4]OWV20231.1 hypothetical protein B7990_03400 [Fibrobacter sp. UWB4]
MDYDYKTSKLWNETLGLTNDANQDKINILQASFIQTRERIAEFLGKIPSLFPGYTVHNISHSDALWQMTDIILTDSEIKINPVEAYVLGCSFLFHDLGMSPAIYNDYSSLRETDLWKDTYAYFIRETHAQDEAQRKADEETIRKQHTLNAKELPLFRFEAEKGFKKEYAYLIENPDLRESFGSTIGEIAASHGLAMDEIEKETLNEEISPSGFPSQWKLSPLKLACILRIADAIHITADRTPYILWFTQKLNNQSRLHWNFHSKLHNPSVQKGQLVYISNSAFSKSERDSWWLCHDTLKMINQELRDVDLLFSRLNIEPLGAYCVKDIDSPKALSTHIKVDGWTPVDIQMKVTNVSSLVQSLGGVALYGDNQLVPLREMVQNASDAIRARRKMDNEDESWGDINITIDTSSEEPFIEVEDTGIGMSEKVLAGPFLDFGTSFWHSSLMRDELPGLENSGFQSTGHFGIGFYSVFMLGDKVTVTTRRYDEHREDTRVLEFTAGSKSRPLLRRAEQNEYIKNGGTKIRVHLKDPSKLSDELAETKVPIDSYIASLFSCMDCNIYLTTNMTSKKKIISANDWKTMDPFDFLKRIHANNKRKYYHFGDKEINDAYLKEISSRVRLVKNQKGDILGRGCLDANVDGFLTVGGIAAGNTRRYMGVLTATCHEANRYRAYPCISESDFKKWIEEQVEILSEDLSWEKDDPDFQIASVVHAFCANTKNLHVAYYKGKPVNYNDIKQIINTTAYNKYVIFQKTMTDILEEHNIVYSDNTFWSVSFIPYILRSSNFRMLRTFNRHDYFPIYKETMILSTIIAKACAEVWQEDVNLITKESTIDQPIKEVVGTISGKEIIEACDYVITKSPKEAPN